MDKKQLITEYVDKHVIGGALLRDATATHVYNRVKPGNEKTPYINQIIPAVQLSVTHRELKTMYAGKPYRDLGQRLTFAATLKFYLEAINIYRESLEAKNIYIGDYEIKLQLTAYREYDNQTIRREISISGNGTAPIGDVSANGYNTNSGSIQATGTCSAINFPNLDKLDNAIPTPPIDLKVEVVSIKFDCVILRDENGDNVDYVKGITNDQSYIIAGSDSNNTKFNVITLNVDKQTEIRSAYYDWECRDPRQNSEPSDWDLFKGRIKGEITEANIPNLGSANSNATFNPEDIIG